MEYRYYDGILTAAFNSEHVRTIIVFKDNLFTVYVDDYECDPLPVFEEEAGFALEEFDDWSTTVRKAIVALENGLTVPGVFGEEDDG